jgi:hypothetical protein
MKEIVSVEPFGLPGSLQRPQSAKTLVVFAHGSGSSRKSPRNRQVANALNAMGLAAYLFDLLHRGEEEDQANVFDIGLLIALALDAPADLILVRKLGVPWQPELAMGAVVDGPQP